MSEYTSAAVFYEPNKSVYESDELYPRDIIEVLHIGDFDGSSLASGIYFYRFESPGFDYNGKMLLVK